VHHKRVARLLQQMGSEAIYAKPHLRQGATGHTVYPYWLRGVQVARVHHVWSTAITSIRLHQGFVSRVAVLDWCSRSGLRWALSVTLDGQWCRDALPQALCQGQRPEIFHTDQGVQCTSQDCTQLLAHEGMRIRMDGRGRALDHVCVERLWRTVKYEEV
jgi:putative transposase